MADKLNKADGSKTVVRFVLPAPEDCPTPEAVNTFFFTFVGSEVQLLVGYVDPRAIHEAKQGSESQAPVRPMITHRLSITPIGFKHLREQLNDIAAKYDAAQKTAN